jgi:hypothetical protein
MSQLKPTASTPSTTSTLGKHTGSCHCGAVRYEVELDLAKGGSRCNCSICMKLGCMGSMVKPPAFRLLAGEESLGRYSWGQQISARHFCTKCGVYVFGKGHLAQLGGDFVSINMNTLDDVDPNTLSVVHWDGRHDNWQVGPRGTPWPIFTAAAG